MCFQYLNKKSFFLLKSSSNFITNGKGSDLCLKYFSKGKGSTLCLGPNNLDLRKLILIVVATGLGTDFCNDFDGEIGF